MLWIFLAGLAFVGAHLLISSTGLRQRLIGVLGEKGYLALYSVLALVTISYLVWIYGELPRYDYVWSPTPMLYTIAKVIMPFSMFLLLGGFLVKNPSNVGMEGLLEGPAAASDLARGVTRITRHPLQWGIALWAIAHLLANGDTVSIVFFSSFLTLALLGSVLLDARKAASMGEGWQRYVAITSNVPFLAILQGRNKLVLGELWLPLIVGLIGYGLLLWGHVWVSGVRII